MADFVVRFPRMIITLFAAVTVFFALQIPHAELDTELKNQLPPDLETRVNLDRIESLFGGTDMAMIVVSSADILEPKTLSRIKRLSKGMSDIEELDRVVSLFSAKDIRAEDDMMIVEQAIVRFPSDADGREALRRSLANNSFVYGNLISKDFRHTALIGFLTLDASDEVLVEKLENLVSNLAEEIEEPGAIPNSIYIGGMPVTRVSLTTDMREDMRKFLPIGLVAMLAFLFVCFRQARGVLLPFVMTVMAIIVSMGLVPLLGWKIHTVTILLPVILLAVANDYGIHMVARFQEDNTPCARASSKDLAHRGIVELTRPVLATGVTTISGLLCLLSHIVVPAEQLGILAACGVAFAVLGSLLFIPATLSLLPLPEPAAHTRALASQHSLLDRILLAVAHHVPRHARSIVFACLVVACGTGLGALRLVVDTNPMSFYGQDEPVWRSTHILNERLGGWAGISTIVKGDIKDPKVLRQIDALETHLRDHEFVGTTTSIAAVVRKMNLVMHDNDPAFDRIPDSRDLVAQYLLLYSMSGDPEDFEKLVDFPYEHAQVLAKVTDSGTRAATEVVRYTNSYLAQHSDGPFELVGGFLHVMADLVNHIVRGQLLSIALSIGIVGVIVGGLMRSFVAAALAMFPLLLALLMIFGVMGFAGIELNLITALLSSIMIGVGVDYTIHFLWRYRDERRSGLEPRVAVRRTWATTGRGIVFNALSVLVGFSVLMLSAFLPVRFFGLLVAISIAACLVGAMVVLPALVVIFRPRFLEPTEASGVGSGPTAPQAPSTRPAS